MEIHLLDVGSTKYGDCLVLHSGDRWILIDGAHPGDDNRISNQLRLLFGHDAPFNFDLLIVTHCHSDHIGCLPALVASGTVTCEKALVADERLGWGRSVGDDSAIDSLPAALRAVAFALQEEPFDDASDDEVRKFLDDAATLESKYKDMLTTLGSRVVRYGRDSATRVAEIENAFTDFGLKILGPTQDHLVRCAQYLADFTDDVSDSLRSDITADALSNPVETYRRAVASMAQTADSRPSDDWLEDRVGSGAAKNDQSIVIKVASQGKTALLAGDMQFAKAEVPGLEDDMTALRAVVEQNGPYDFIKLTHHSSYNGFDLDVWNEWITPTDTYVFAHTGGKNDVSHPDRGVLSLLKDYRDQLQFARTDRNGLISVRLDQAGVNMTVSRGQLNNFARNQVADVETTPAVVKAEPQKVTISASPEFTGPTERIEFSAVFPPHTTRLTITIDLEPEKKKPVATQTKSASLPRKESLVENPVSPGDSAKLGNGRQLPSLLFVSSNSRLSGNIGHAAVAQARTVVTAAGQDWLDVDPADARSISCFDFVREALNRKNYSGVVLVGGLDVVPAERLDVLDPQSRQEVKSLLRQSGGRGDSDDFVVWSDEIYGDRDGDCIPELPVSRIPDGRNSALALTQIAATFVTYGLTSGVRNAERPFAQRVFDSGAVGAGRLSVCEPTTPDSLPREAISGSLYFMLHGRDTDSNRYWGENDSGDTIEAFNMTNVPASLQGCCVFLGCCWGALSALPRASKYRTGDAMQPKTADTSLALAFLARGANAVVGCTGTHYSPDVEPYNYFGQPMHTSYWNGIRNGLSPSQAIFDAKRQYAIELPHGQMDPISRAIELKICRQFTCLGLGW